ncbi:MAG: hypothetical protein M3P40_00155, partial [Actinomycetota bacterium]|nr:hypothetical protein [Actinomycetota bacterium]
MSRGRNARTWLGAALALMLLVGAAVAGGLALQRTSRDVVAQGPDDRARALRRLEADRAARERRA